MNDEIQRRLVAAFPASADANVVRAVREGVLLADGARESEAFLRNMVGRDLRGLLRRAGILYRLHEMAKAGDLPFTTKMIRMTRGSWHYVEIRSGQFRAHVCRTHAPDAFPEDTPTKQDHRVVNQADLFDPAVTPMRGIADGVRHLYAWLNFGAGENGELHHVCWAAPDKERSEWLGHIDVMRRLAISGGSPAPAEPPARKQKLRFKDEIAEALGRADKVGDVSNDNK